MNRKGQLKYLDQFYLLLIVMVALIFIMGAFFVWGLLAPSTAGLISDVTGSVKSAGANTSDQNISDAVNVPADAILNSINNLEWITYAILFGAVFGFITMCFFVRTYPFLLVFWIILMGLIALISLFLTDAYQGVVTGNDYVSTASQSWATTNFILLHLPLIIVGVGILGGIIMFMLISREPEAETGVLGR